MLVTIVSFIIVLGVLIFIHEFGHYITAKKVGIRVEEFALGFGPKLVSKRRGDTLYSIRIIPLGGFCKMTGEFPPDEEMTPEEEEVYQEARAKGELFTQKSTLQRSAVIFNGPFMNFMLAVLIFGVIFNFYGLPVDSINSNIIGDIIPGQPAAESGFRVGDRILSIDGREVSNWDDVANVIHQAGQKELTIKIERQEEVREIVVTSRYDESLGGGYIGIGPELVKKDVGIFEAIRLGFRQTIYVFKLIFSGFIQMITGRAPAEVGGPIMIANMVGQAADIGLTSLLNLTAIISINLGIINLLPFPALDGGRLIFIILEMLRGRPVDPKKEGMVHIVGFAILIILMVFLIYKDLGRTFF